MSEMNRQQICAALGVSESTIRRLEQVGLPYTPVGKRAKRYDLAESKAWLRANQECLTGSTTATPNLSEVWAAGKEFSEYCRKVKLRVMPSE